MHVGVGYSEKPDTSAAGRQAAQEALQQAGRAGPCDMVLLFATARHNAEVLRAAVADVVGPAVSIVGGGAVGAIVNDRFGYAGDQVVLAAFWLSGSQCDIIVEGGMAEDEEDVGKRLGKRLADRGTAPESPVFLFYDAIGGIKEGGRMVTATHLLRGMEEGLGFLPDLVGGGLLGDYINTPTEQWTGQGIHQNTALALAFSGNVHLAHTIMHGCRPATGYYTVTKADGQTILEINGKPALEFMNTLLGAAISPSRYPFFLIFGVNLGDKWGEFDESGYTSRLCLAIDEGRGGIVMFEPDMVAGTEFQIMYRSIEHACMIPRIEAVFDNLEGREPVLALYINCAGRAAGYGGMELEDAVIVQKTVAGRVPLMGIYTGVEIASIKGRPHGLDWTGVFCLLSVQK